MESAAFYFNISYEKVKSTAFVKWVRQDVRFTRQVKLYLRRAMVDWNRERDQAQRMKRTLLWFSPIIIQQVIKKLRFPKRKL